MNRSARPSGGEMKTHLRWLAFSAILAATMMDLLDATIAGVAGPVMRADLGGSLADLQWMTAAYTLAMAVMLLTGGRLGDIFGRRRMLLIGVAGFTLSSLAVAAAPSMEVLIAARTLQGAFGAVMLPQGFGLIRELFPPQELGKVWGIFGPIAGLSAILGPVVAGLLIHAADWLATFLVNVPIGAVVVLAGAKLLPETARIGAGRADETATPTGAGAGRADETATPAGVGAGRADETATPAGAG